MTHELTLVVCTEPQSMPKFAVILPAAGKSTRLAMKNRKKVFLDLKGRAVWLRTAEHFTNRDDVVQTIIVISPEDMEFFKEKYAPNLAFMNIEIVAGGADRCDSVRNGPGPSFLRSGFRRRPRCGSPAVVSGMDRPSLQVGRTIRRRDRGSSGHQYLETS